MNNKFALLITAIVVITLGTRLYNLNFQSLWFDELYSVTVAAPGNSYDDILTDIKTDFHPPFYYFFLNTLFKVISYNDLSARLLSVIAGCLGIWFIYLIGSRIRNNTYGAWLALFLSAFFFHIKYSQEARMYIFLFVFSIITTLLILGYIEKKKKFYLLLYLLSCLIMIYMHYFGFFVLFAHAVWALHLYLIKRIDTKELVNVALMFFVLFLLYLPWLPVIFKTGTRTHIMEASPPWFLIEYIYEYTGKEPVTSLFILTGLVLYTIAGVRKVIRRDLSLTPFQLLTFYIFLSVFVLTFFISFYKPILNKQSTLAGLPFLLIMAFTGYRSIRSSILYKIITLVVVSGLINLAFISKYYKVHHKENFRQITEKVTNGGYSPATTSVISQVSKFYNYYFEQEMSPLKAQNPNTFHTGDLPSDTQCIIVLNAPYTAEKEPVLESMDRLGFEIMNPRLLNQIDSVELFQTEWNDYIARNYFLSDTIYNPAKGTAVGYVHRIKSQLKSL